MRRRKLLKDQDRQKLFRVPTDEESLIRHYSLSPVDCREIELRRRDHNRLRAENRVARVSMMCAAS